MSFASAVESSIQTLFNNVNNGFLGDASTGQNQVSYWLEQLRHSNDPSLRPITAELEFLRSHIEHGNAAAMAASFQKLGELTAVSAKSIHSFSGEGDKARELSQKLIAAAGNLRLVAQKQAH